MGLRGQSARQIQTPLTLALNNLEKFDAVLHLRQEDNSLIVPNEEDWLTACKILYLLSQSRKRSQKGRLSRLPPGVSQRMALDVLIAVSARRYKAQLVTDNWADFKAIQRYCPTRIIRAAEFFKK